MLLIWYLVKLFCQSVLIISLNFSLGSTGAMDIILLFRLLCHQNLVSNKGIHWDPCYLDWS